MEFPFFRAYSFDERSSSTSFIKAVASSVLMPVLVMRQVFIASERTRLEGEEAEYYKEREGKDFKPWAALIFANEDYEE